MAKSNKNYNINNWKNPNKKNWLRLIITFPFIEAIVALIPSIVFFCIDQKILAGLTCVLGPLLSISRIAFEKYVVNEFESLNKLTQHVDLIQSDISDSFKRIIQLYAQISEPDFREIKENIIHNAESKLSNLAHNKQSDELNTGEYFDWLFRFLANTRAKSKIWAISMNLNIEWNTSQEEDTFLELNLDATKRNVTVERIFVVSENSITEMIQNKYVEKQLEVAKTNNNLIPLFVTKEHLEKVDNKLLKSLGEGIIAVDNQVVLVDIASDDGFRGIVTMNPTKIRDWQTRFNQLRVYASNIETLQANISSNKKN